MRSDLLLCLLFMSPWPWPPAAHKKIHGSMELAPMASPHLLPEAQPAHQFVACLPATLGGRRLPPVLLRCRQASLLQVSFKCSSPGVIRNLGIGNGDRAACQGHLEVYKYLVEELGCDPNMVASGGSCEGATPFVVSAQSGDISTVKMVLI